MRWPRPDHSVAPRFHDSKVDLALPIQIHSPGFHLPDKHRCRIRRTAMYFHTTVDASRTQPDDRYSGPRSQCKQHKPPYANPRDVAFFHPMSPIPDLHAVRLARMDQSIPSHAVSLAAPPSKHAIPLDIYPRIWQDRLISREGANEGHYKLDREKKVAHCLRSSIHE